MIDWVVERCQAATTLDHVLIATTDRPQDDALEQIFRERGWDFIRGPEDDVLTRFVMAARHATADRIVRVTSDCPFIDPKIIDSVVTLMDGSPNLDYACNFLPRRWYPRGLDVECLTLAALDHLDASVVEPRWREHVTLGIYERPGAFVTGGITPESDFSHHRWTVDTMDDWLLASQMAMAVTDTTFGWREMMRLAEQNPEWQKLNSHVQQKVA
jgi:spore coat polysaccharide biosynthesis protein SpsF